MGLFTCVSAGPSSEKILRASGSFGWFPYLMLDKNNGSVSGVASEILEKIGKKLNIQVDIVSDYPWKRVLHFVEKGKLDICLTIYWNEKRENRFIYSAPYWKDEIRVFVKRGKEFHFKGFSDLKGRVGGIPLGASYGQEFDAYAKENLIIDETAREKKGLFDKVLTGRNDYFISAIYDVIEALKKEGLEGEIVPLHHPIAFNDVYWIMSKHSAHRRRLPEMNRLILEMRKSGRIQQMVDSYVK